ncbi:MAG: DUF6320 domain-containing protein [Clostridia bacterium]|nr:DUF6320 domain-containing protein [Clostridia bacterium]
MPYCVKCGVELGSDEENCPLCSTPVYKPETMQNIPNKKPNLERERASIRYIKNRYINISGFCILSVMIILSIINLSISGKIDWSGMALLSLALLWFLMVFPVKYCDKLHPVIISSVCAIVVSVFLLIIDSVSGFSGWSLIVLISTSFASFSVALPLLNKRLSAVSVISLTALGAALYILLLDLILGFGGWSVYAAGGIVLTWSFIFLPRYIKRKYTVFTAIATDSILILAYLFFVLSANGHMNKFLSFALPLVITASLPVMLIYSIYKIFKLSIYGILSLCFFFASLAALSIDLILNYNVYMHDLLFHEWSLITASCCMVIALLLFIIEKNSKFREFLNKKMKL